MPTTSCGSRRKSASGKARAAAILRAVPPVAFAALILVFAADRTRCAAAYAVYGLSAYALVILLAAVPRLTRRAKSAVTRSGPVQRLLATEMGRRYLGDTAFRCGVGICRGMAANLACGLFRAAVGIRYVSAWMIALAVYDLALGAIRAYLIVGYCHRERYGVSYEYNRYRGAAWMWLLRKVVPYFRCIADFRKDNATAIKEVFRAFVALCNKEGLLSHESVVIDGTKFRAVNADNKSYVSSNAYCVKIQQFTDLFYFLAFIAQH